MSESITAVWHFRQAPEQVWRALSEAERIAAWLMPNDFQAVVGHRFTFRTQPIPPHFDGIVQCEVLAVDPPRRLVYAWRGGGLDTQVRFELAADGDGTVLHFEHSGFDTSQPGQAAALKGMEPGWSRHIAARLAAVVESLGQASQAPTR